MDHKTTIALYISGEEISKNEVIQKVESVKKYIIEMSPTYGFQLKSPDSVDVDGADCNEMFNNLISLLQENDVEEDGVAVFLDSMEDYGKYKCENLPDVEDGDIEFSKSICISEWNIIIYLNTEEWYSSELESLENQGLGIGGDMNDEDGDYYEFEI